MAYYVGVTKISDFLKAGCEVGIEVIYVLPTQSKFGLF